MTSTASPPMQTELSRTAATSFYQHFQARDFTRLALLFHPTATYWVSGSPSLVPWAGDMPAAERIPALPTMMNVFEEFHVEKRAILADQGQAIFEFRVAAREPGEAGLRYENDVVMIFQVDENGLIVSLREYLDNMQPLAYFAAKQSTT